MFIEWNEKNCRWFKEASSFTGFHKTLAQKILPLLEPGDTLCDIGCGLGRLVIEIAPYLSEILAVDTNEYAINTLKQDVEHSGIGNVRTRRCDFAEVEGSFDVVLLSLFGHLDIQKVFKLCRRRIIRIVSASQKSGLYPQRHRREVKNFVPLTQEELSKLGIDFKLELCTFEFGQPLRTKQDAASFVQSNAPEANKEEIDEFLSENIQSTGNADFPFYLPYSKDLGIFVIDKP